ncbi:hypothetical protein BESB_017190 [Besnoitia besnoiti]|uniref:Uncharacterized protein n=1 Tax=Besnoitia besnoiti TaxID=94643 RepID=A0A2A9M7Y0_BESBE|nr:hypothetical protein BESB_017190 [Besnoitia besnoiti]PFH32401.1 hypothetical protein BESB_017190 [Besnoitia besnoiti]
MPLEEMIQEVYIHRDRMKRHIRSVDKNDIAAALLPTEKWDVQVSVHLRIYEHPEQTAAAAAAAQSGSEPQATEVDPVSSQQSRNRKTASPCLPPAQCLRAPPFSSEEVSSPPDASMAASDTAFVALTSSRGGENETSGGTGNSTAGSDSLSNTIRKDRKPRVALGTPAQVFSTSPASVSVPPEAAARETASGKNAVPVEGDLRAPATPKPVAPLADAPRDSPRVRIRTDLSRVADPAMAEAEAAVSAALQDAKEAHRAAKAACGEAVKAARAACLWRDPGLCPEGPIVQGAMKMPLEQLEEAAELLLRLLDGALRATAENEERQPTQRCEKAAAGLAGHDTPAGGRLRSTQTQKLLDRDGEAKPGDAEQPEADVDGVDGEEDSPDVASLLTATTALVLQAKRAQLRADVAIEAATEARARARLFRGELQARKQAQERERRVQDGDGFPRRFGVHDRSLAAPHSRPHPHGSVAPAGFTRNVGPARGTRVRSVVRSRDGGREKRAAWPSGEALGASLQTPAAPLSAAPGAEAPRLSHARSTRTGSAEDRKSERPASFAATSPPPRQGSAPIASVAPEGGAATDPGEQEEPALPPGFNEAGRRGRGKSTVLLGPAAAAQLRATTRQLASAALDRAAHGARPPESREAPAADAGGRRRAIFQSARGWTEADEDEREAARSRRQEGGPAVDGETADGRSQQRPGSWVGGGRAAGGGSPEAEAGQASSPGATADAATRRESRRRRLGCPPHAKGADAGEGVPGCNAPGQTAPAEARRLTAAPVRSCASASLSRSRAAPGFGPSAPSLEGRGARFASSAPSADGTSPASPCAAAQCSTGLRDLRRLRAFSAGQRLALRAFSVQARMPTAVSGGAALPRGWSAPGRSSEAPTPLRAFQSFADARGTVDSRGLQRAATLAGLPGFFSPACAGSSRLLGSSSFVSAQSLAATRRPSSRSLAPSPSPLSADFLERRKRALSAPGFASQAAAQPGESMRPRRLLSVWSGARGEQTPKEGRTTTRSRYYSKFASLYRAGLQGEEVDSRSDDSAEAEDAEDAQARDEAEDEEAAAEREEGEEGDSGDEEEWRHRGRLVGNRRQRTDIRRRVAHVAAFLDLLRCLLPAHLSSHGEWKPPRRKCRNPDDTRNREEGRMLSSLQRPSCDLPDASAAEAKGTAEGKLSSPSSLSASASVARLHPSEPEAHPGSAAADCGETTGTGQKESESYTFANPNPQVALHLLTSRPFVATFGELLQKTLCREIATRPSPLPCPSNASESPAARRDADLSCEDSICREGGSDRDGEAATLEGAAQETIQEETKETIQEAAKEITAKKRHTERVRFACDGLDEAEHAGGLAVHDAVPDAQTQQRDSGEAAQSDSADAPGADSGFAQTAAVGALGGAENRETDARESKCRSPSPIDTAAPQGGSLSAVAEALSLIGQRRRLAEVLRSRSDPTRDTVSVFFVDPETRCALPVAVAALLRLLTQGFVVELAIARPSPARVRWSPVYRRCWAALLRPFLRLRAPSAYRHRPRRLRPPRGSASRCRSRDLSEGAEGDMRARGARERQAEAPARRDSAERGRDAGTLRSGEMGEKTQDGSQGTEATRAEKIAGEAAGRAGCPSTSLRNVLPPRAAPPPHVLCAVQRELRLHPELRQSQGTREWFNTNRRRKAAENAGSREEAEARGSRPTEETTVDEADCRGREQHAFSHPSPDTEQVASSASPGESQARLGPPLSSGLARESRVEGEAAQVSTASLSAAPSTTVSRVQQAGGERARSREEDTRPRGAEAEAAAVELARVFSPDANLRAVRRGGGCGFRVTSPDEDADCGQGGREPPTARWRQGYSAAGVVDACIRVAAGAPGSNPRASVSSGERGSGESAEAAPGGWAAGRVLPPSVEESAFFCLLVAPRAESAQPRPAFRRLSASLLAASSSHSTRTPSHAGLPHALATPVSPLSLPGGVNLSQLPSASSGTGLHGGVKPPSKSIPSYASLNHFTAFHAAPSSPSSPSSPPSLAAPLGGRLHAASASSLTASPTPVSSLCLLPSASQSRGSLPSNVLPAYAPASLASRLGDLSPSCPRACAFSALASVPSAPPPPVGAPAAPEPRSQESLSSFFCPSTRPQALTASHSPPSETRDFRRARASALRSAPPSSSPPSSCASQAPSFAAVAESSAAPSFSAEVSPLQGLSLGHVSFDLKRKMQEDVGASSRPSRHGRPSALARAFAADASARE